jgi:hypothetical protein
MRRKRLLIVAGMLILLFSSIGTVMALMVCHEPAFYRRCATVPGPERKKSSEICNGKFLNLVQFIRFGRDRYSLEITQNELNSYFEEDFQKWGDARNLESKGITDFRVAVEPRRIRLGFRYGRPPWSTIVNFDLRVWVVPKETNTIAIEILGRHAGAFPISTQSILDLISEQATSLNIEVNWYRNGANPVALVHFVSERPTFQLQHLHLGEGKITIGGMALDPRIPNF